MLERRHCFPATALISFIAFIGDERGQLDGYILVIANPKYNPYEDTIEMAEWTLLRIIPDIEAAEAE